MGWQWIDGDTDVPELTERASFREVLLRGRLAAALRKLNLRDGQPWLDDDRIRRIPQGLKARPMPPAPHAGQRHHPPASRRVPGG